MTESAIDVTVVVPCYNEEDRLDAGAFAEYRGSEGLDVRFLFVDDGSTDGTPALLAELAADAPHVRVLTLGENKGKGEAVRRGLLRALRDDIDVVAYWDADLSTPLSILPTLCERLFAHDELHAVIGARVRLLGRRIARRPVRHYLGRVFATGASLAIDLPVYDTQCGAKVFRPTEEVIASLQSPFRSRWAFDVELLARLTRRAKAAIGGETAHDIVREYPLPEWTYHSGTRLRPGDLVRTLYDLLIIWWHARRS